ncbi:MAG: KH domain-containing protein [Ruminococcaceae bacterium]|nr:KH domain-containing protein [Oscillospiraceae bacterium]
MVNLKEILADIARAIVDHPDDVVVTEEEKGNDVTLTLAVHEDDMGMVIGRHGRIAKAIRSVMKSVAGTCGKRVNVEIKD